MIVCDTLICCGLKEIRSSARDASSGPSGLGRRLGGFKSEVFEGDAVPFDRLPWELFPDCGRASVAVSYNFETTAKPGARCTHGCVQLSEKSSRSRCNEGIRSYADAGNQGPRNHLRVDDKISEPGCSLFRRLEISIIHYITGVLACSN